MKKQKADLEEKGLGDHVIVLNESSATVAEAAHALGVEPASIAKTLSVCRAKSRCSASTRPSSFWAHWAFCPRHQRDAA